jgi:hypothetical protein
MVRGYGKSPANKKRKKVTKGDKGSPRIMIVRVGFSNVKLLFIDVSFLMMAFE